MSSSTKVLSPERPSDNPIKAILEKIPYTDSILDVKLLDAIILEFVRLGHKAVTNSAVMVLLLELNKADLITLTCYQYPSTLGQLFIIKRNY